MYSFRNDYSELAHPLILEALAKTNTEQAAGYGLDKHCENAASIIRELVGDSKADVHFLVGGTQTNLTAISAFLRPHEAVVAADTSHIATHEAGAIEATGHKIITVKEENGKITTDKIAEQLEIHNSEHLVKPSLVKISNSTELGTVYDKSELENISAFCSENNLLLYVDGARLGAALTSERAVASGLSLKDMYNLTDAFYIGGTKNGALIGEALVIRNDALKTDFRYLMKQRGALLAKSKIIGIQFETLFADDLYFKLAANAGKMAHLLNEGIENAGYKLLAPTETNQVFPIFENSLIEVLSRKFEFEFWQKHDENSSVIRLVTSWATNERAVRELLEGL